ncbi:MAG: GntR family transcriptional regulator [Bacteroidota bacterium]
MQFQEKSAIYRQIAEFGIDQVLEKEWSVGERIPSVRQLAAEVGVNANTVMQSYRWLEEQGIIINQRGRGFYVADSGLTKATDIRKQDFIEAILPRISHDLKLLGISTQELIELLNNYQKQQA